jgi:hypothetical protein
VDDLTLPPEAATAGAVIVTREIDLELAPAELWALVSDGSTWAGWLGAASDVEVVDGGGGTVVDDDGVIRRVRVERVDRDLGVRFHWWPVGTPDGRSTVDLVVTPGPAGGRLLVREVLATVGPVAGASLGQGTGASVDSVARATVGSLRAWDIRALMLWALAATSLPV